MLDPDTREDEPQHDPALWRERMDEAVREAAEIAKAERAVVAAVEAWAGERRGISESPREIAAAESLLEALAVLRAARKGRP